MRNAIVLLLLVGLFALACDEGENGGPTSTLESTEAEATAVPARFEESACNGLLPEELQEESARCGFAIVPEDRTDPDGPSIRLAVAVLPATSDNPAPDPLVFLSGVPVTPLSTTSWPCGERSQHRFVRRATWSSSTSVEREDRTQHSTAQSSLSTRSTTWLRV